MKRKFKILTLLLGAIIMFSACEEDERLYSDVDPFNDDLKTVTIVSSASTTLVIDPESATTVYNIGVKVNGKVPAQDMSIELVIDSTNLTADQYDLAGTSIVIPAGSNRGSIALTLYKDEFFPGEVFNLYYSLGTPSIGDVNELGSSGTITMYNPGFLGPWVASFSAYCDSYGDVYNGYGDGDWDEEWNDVVIELDPEDPLNKVLIYGVADSDIGLSATIDVDALTITIPSGQLIGDVYGYGPVTPLLGDPSDFSSSSDPIVGTVDAETGAIYVDNWMQFITEGTYGAWPWDIFEVTFTTDGKKSNSNFVERIPKGKKLTKFE